jgi:hypothetical protein
MKTRFMASVKAVAVSDENNSCVSCHEPFLRKIARKWDREKLVGQWYCSEGESHVVVQPLQILGMRRRETSTPVNGSLNV